MNFPPLDPKPGQRVHAPLLAGSSDAWFLAEAARGGKTLAVFTANAWDAQRLMEEIRWFAPELNVCLFPDWETLPYDAFSPHPDLVSERLATLYQLARGQFQIVLAPLSTALYRLAPPAFLLAHTFFLKQGKQFDEAAFREQMRQGGYTHVNQVYAPGEFSIRGGLIDLFPMGSVLPYRIDLFDNEIESLRAFDVDTQRSVYPVKDVRLLPAREFPLDENGIKLFRQQFRETFEGDPSRSKLYKDVSNGLAPAGIEYYLPLFFEGTATLFDYLPKDVLLTLHGDAPGTSHEFWQDTQSRYRLLAGEKDRPLLPPERLFLNTEQFFQRANDFARLDLGKGETAATQSVPEVVVDRRLPHPVARLDAFLKSFPGKVLILAPSQGRQETLAEYLKEHGLHAERAENWQAFLDSSKPLQLGPAPLAAGFVYPEQELAVITETELYALPPRHKREKRGKTTPVDNLIRDLSELKIGDPVVHVQHGVGRYQGLVTMDLGEGPTEFLLLEYANADKLYVPVSQLEVISRYSGASADDAPLHRLGTEQWEKARRKAMQAARDTAAELLDLYARRAAREGHAFSFSEHDYQAFADSFGFEETPDQAEAIRATLADMQSGKPMDRLVCGDVGFGKTEVALRAAFAAVAGGKQVALLAPTTLLVEQHFQNFADRFSPWPVKIAELSRFRSAKEQAQALQDLKDGKIDIIIGTHRLIQKDVAFRNLGLIIIDEEHRFGVRQKERLKQLRAEVDVLTLTATPIPRTLAMSLEGIRDFSVIATAPQKRLAVKTFVRPYSPGLVREAVLRELRRGGQVFFLHNEVDSIYRMQEKLVELLPEARIRVGHGQMPERELEHVMRDFTQQRFDLLLCTTIIETGIDIPTANTILINRADKFGLAQMHQLRGRVGRSHHQAFAYLLVEEEAALSALAKKRLEAIQMMEDLGAGFYLAMHDLEIRGAGEVLGEKQSGDMLEVGFSLYNDMLGAAVASLKAGREPDLAEPLGAVSEINLHQPALLPETYCADVHERLVIYKRLANCKTADDITELGEELIDRFGLLPEPARVLLAGHKLRLQAKPLGITRLDATADGLNLQFMKNPPIDPVKILLLVQSRAGLKLAGPDRLKLQKPLPDLEAKLKAASELMDELKS
ncbi:transcription-repair coupling factor [Betaproteobacteria bacterium SCN2]|jgi:transcription-repair coupling factor (superfamily II helicase)|nr:transcription-repair coupling factor [Betaproteobacteria bacterium SCN2]